MKRSLIILCILLPAFSWAQPREDLSERALELCQFIPDQIKSVSRVSKDRATAVITVRETWEGEFIDTEENAREYGISLKRVNGQWLLDDFDGKKAECVDYIKEMRAKYKSGELLEYMESEDYFHEYIPDFKRRVEEFYRKYGTE